MTKRALGVCYYPEHWPEEGWAEDARRMAVAAQDWADLARDESALRALAVRLDAGLPPADPEAEPYAAAQALIEGSQKDRAAIVGALTN